jgi:hypothetical protein
MQVDGTPERIKEFKEFVAGDNGPIDFEEIVPMPGHIDCGNLSFEDMKRNPNNWYDWSVKNWGTKWNACYVDVTFESDDEVHYQFETAWDYPHPIIRELRRKFPDLEIGGGGYIEGFEESFDLDDPQFQPGWEEEDEVA